MYLKEMMKLGKKNVVVDNDETSEYHYSDFESPKIFKLSFPISCWPTRAEND